MKLERLEPKEKKQKGLFARFEVRMTADVPLKNLCTDMDGKPEPQNTEEFIKWFQSVAESENCDVDELLNDWDILDHSEMEIDVVVIDPAEASQETLGG